MVRPTAPRRQSKPERGLSANLNPPAPSQIYESSRWGAFGHAAFTAIWTGSIIANVGTALYDTGSRWLMTTLDADPMAVSLVQVAVSLPIFLFTIPAGALADIINPRRLLIIVEIANTIMTGLLATLVWSGLATVSSLLLTTFLLGVGGALAAPAWMAIVPLLVNRDELQGAIAANGVGFNITRAVGPAVGGFVIAGLGIAAPFWICAASNLFAIAALLYWRAPRRSIESLPAERLTTAIRTGVRHAANNRHLRATLMRTLAFFTFASAYFALLPLVARDQLTQGPQLYGILLGAIGAGAIGGSFVLAWLRESLGPDRLVAFGSLATAFALVLFGVARNPATLVCACLIAGAALDRRADQRQCLGPGRVARLGARPRTGGVADRDFRRDDGRQRAMGTDRRRRGPPDGAFRRGCWNRARHSLDMALEASDRPRRRSDAGDALAQTGRQSKS
jgi:MFS family permease